MVLSLTTKKEAMRHQRRICVVGKSEDNKETVRFLPDQARIREDENGKVEILLFKLPL